MLIGTRNLSSYCRNFWLKTRYLCHERTSRTLTFQPQFSEWDKTKQIWSSLLYFVAKSYQKLNICVRTKTNIHKQKEMYFLLSKMKSLSMFLTYFLHLSIIKKLFILLWKNNPLWNVWTLWIWMKPNCIHNMDLGTYCWYLVKEVDW